jgi:hypothetical protein
VGMSQQGSVQEGTDIPGEQPSICAALWQRVGLGCPGQAGQREWARVRQRGP